MPISNFDQAGYRFDLDFGIQIFEQVGVLIFVRLRWYGVTGTPKRTNIGNQDSLGLWIPDSNNWIPDLFQ